MSPREKKLVDWRHNDRPNKPWSAEKPVNKLDTVRKLFLVTQCPSDPHIHIKKYNNYNKICYRIGSKNAERVVEMGLLA
jgi:hypothetical protein